MATATAMKHKTVRRVIDPALFDAEDQAELCEKQMDVRGGVKCLDGQLTRLRGKLMRANMILDPVRLKDCLVELRSELDRVIADTERLAS